MAWRARVDVQSDAATFRRLPCSSWRGSLAGHCVAQQARVVSATELLADARGERMAAWKAGPCSRLLAVHGAGIRRARRGWVRSWKPVLTVRRGLVGFSRLEWRTLDRLCTRPPNKGMKLTRRGWKWSEAW